MSIQLLTNIDWLNVGIGFLVGGTLLGIAFSQTRARLTRQLNELEQQQTLLQAQLAEKQQQHISLLDEHDLL
ncbi:hypothetical protein LCGC14_2067820, partial [marine sediment metagenome]